ncbi:D-tyrosyl-tRNA(Tyr) deacylase [Bifidobacterium longum subsp. longum]|nr:D-tyrosyl-tRNA(Tyr) deacylase [Bifidobacterium longum subsp. longum]TCF39517.1 D-tyrosyl-tRNA(Tyr) deacylase [Bifidobacterium longum subsp. longum]
MKVVLQRVSEASVDVVNELGTLDPTFEPQQIGPGFMILVGVTDEDGDKQIAWLAHKILNLRVFEDAQGKMNRSIQDIGGEILSISQFTLFADVHKAIARASSRPASPSMPISCGSSSTRRCAPGECR